MLLGLCCTAGVFCTSGGGGACCVAGTNSDNSGVSNSWSASNKSLLKLPLFIDDDSDGVDTAGVPWLVELGLLDVNLPRESRAYKWALLGVTRVFCCCCCCFVYFCSALLLLLLRGGFECRSNHHNGVGRGVWAR
jgi:hypothetical protein